MNIHELINQIGSTNSTVEKQNILTNFFNNEHQDEMDIARYVLKNALDPFVTYGVKKFKMGEPISHGKPFSFYWNMATNLLSKLSERSLTGKNALQEIHKISCSLTKEQQEVFSLILGKDLKCGLGAKTVNKVLPNLIKSFEIQLAKDGNIEDVFKYDKFKNVINDHEKSFLNDLTYPVLVEPKLDGMRCMAFIDSKSVTYFSRNGKEFFNYDLFTDVLLQTQKHGYVLDGEVIGDSDNTFEAISNQARRKHNVDSSKLRYLVFDVLGITDFKNKTCTMTQEERTKFLKTFKFDHVLVKAVKGKMCNDPAEVIDFFNMCVSRDYEGVIIKDPKAMYTYKRDGSWLKWKPEITEDFEITGLKEGTGKLKGMLGAFVLDCNGHDLDVGTGFSEEQRKKYFDKKYIGKMCEIKYDCKSKNTVRFPRFSRIRAEEDVV